MSEEFFVGVPKDDEFPLCSVCGEEMVWYQNTLVCKECDKFAIADLTWCKNQKEGRI